MSQAGPDEVEHLDEALSTLGERDVETWRRENIRRRGHEALGAPRRSKLAHGYRRYFEPALVATVCAIHLVWAFGTTASILLR
ncbi:MAG: hypothetical protein DRJ42_15285 [Deltaproteobacteria bacterium]|nr:MAG: hypothetical protein DRJ42_15285 [Deltaproteobacteria bacterium]